jgi:hypothetical protein
MIEWLYKMHNKVNKKLRAQGFCHHENPTLEHVYSLYKPHVHKIQQLMNNHKNDTEHAIQYICNIGYEFLGSIIFNYQGYFANCHTSEEKTKITSTYHQFFNIIPILIKRLLNPGKYGEDYKLKATPKFNIRKILQQNEPYSQLKRWFYECRDLCTLKEEFKTYDEYEHEFQKHIVSNCNNPTADNIKSCRKVSRRTTRKNIKHKS